jgi:hypothetical protein
MVEGVLIAVVGILLSTFRAQAARIAVRQHESLYGRRWDERVFRIWFAVGGFGFVLVGLFRVLGPASSQ